MRFIKDKILILIVLTSLLQIYIISTRADWTTKIVQVNSGDRNHLDLTTTLSIESEHFISKNEQTIGSATYFETKKCFTVDSLGIFMFQIIDGKDSELKKTKTRIEDLSELEFDSSGKIKEESLLKSEKIEICPGRQRIGISNWFEYPDKEENDFKIKYFIKTTDNETIEGAANLTKRTSLEIHGRHHYDFIILLYPVLWVVLGLLTIIKIVKVVREK